MGASPTAAAWHHQQGQHNYSPPRRWAWAAVLLGVAAMVVLVCVLDVEALLERLHSSSSNLPRPLFLRTPPMDLTTWKTAAAASLAAFRAQLAGRSGQISTWTQKDWQQFWPIIGCPPGRPLKRYGGRGDGSKLLCSLDNEHAMAKGGCVIYSMGSNGDFKFELAMLRKTKCAIHTFDCTFDGRSQDGNRRHHYHKICIGAGGATATAATASGADGVSQQQPQFRSWANVTASLGHTNVNLLKLDVEGSEWAVLNELSPAMGGLLPSQISIELHVGVWGGPGSVAALSEVFLHLADLGYASYAQEGNEYNTTCCAELSFMRLQQTL